MPPTAREKCGLGDRSTPHVEFLVAFRLLQIGGCGDFLLSDRCRAVELDAEMLEIERRITAAVAAVGEG
jgi:hypothetical protein